VNATHRTVLVIGGGGGIGTAVSARLAAEGSQVIIVGRSAERGEQALARLRGKVPEGRFLFRRADICRLDSCRDLFDWVNDEVGGLDALVNCASPETSENDGGDRAHGVIAGPFVAIDPAAVGAFLQASLGSLFILCHSALASLRAPKKASLVLFASDSGRVAAPNQTMIGATRAAIMMFTRSLALEVARDGIRVNCVSPSFVANTPVFDRVMQGLGASRAQSAVSRAGLGLAVPDDIAALVAFLCGEDSARLTGQVISVNGGLTAA
jgi:NAD(P)-dependent dehydrogenase (short-subunit alcohol dehydrogenase family)